jgi:hypothetical protein
LLRQVEAITGIIRQFAACFTDNRDPDLIEHILEHLIGLPGLPGTPSAPFKPAKSCE